MFSGASLHVKEPTGETPREIANRKKLLEIVNLLKELEHPVARLILGDQICHYWPDKNCFLAERKKQFKLLAAKLSGQEHLRISHISKHVDLS